MVVRCAILSCKNSRDFDWPEKFSLHQMPRDIDLKKQWLKQLNGYCNRDSYNISTFKICTNHFRKADYIVHTMHGKKVRQLRGNGESDF